MNESQDYIVGVVAGVTATLAFVIPTDYFVGVVMALAMSLPLWYFFLDVVPTVRGWIRESKEWKERIK